MLFERIRITGIALICAALTLAAWKTVARNMVDAPHGDAVRPVSSVTPARGAELTIPVEIVEAGEEPKTREIRIAR